MHFLQTTQSEVHDQDKVKQKEKASQGAGSDGVQDQEMREVRWIGHCQLNTVIISHVCPLHILLSLVFLVMAGTVGAYSS